MKKTILIIILTSLAYSNILGNGFVIDDQYFIKDWSQAHNFSNIGQLLSGANPQSQPGVYRPIRSLLYVIYYQLFGTNPLGYHVHSLVVHLAATILVYFILKELLKSDVAGLIGGVLFGLHPVHVESITYISASMEMTGAVFFFAAFYLYITKRLTLSAWFALLAFFTYEMTLILVFLIPLYDFLLSKFKLKNYLTFWAGAIGFLILRIGILHIPVARGEYLAYSFYHTQLTMVKMYIKYLWLLIFPLNLSHNHTIVPGFEAFMTPYSDQKAILVQSIFDPEILFSITVIIFIIFIIFINRKKQPIISFSLAWFFIALLPVSYIFPQGTAFAEKYLYIASFGFVLLAGFLFIKLPKSLIICVVLLFGLKTLARNQDWHSSQTLWEQEVQIHPQSELAYYNLGIIYANRGDKQRAITAYQKTLQLKPEFWQASHNLNNLLQK